MLRRFIPGLLLIVVAACTGGDTPTAPVTPPAPPAPPAPPTPPPSTEFTVPAIAREFRGMWIATVGNIDWPSRTGLTVAQQQAEMVTLLDLAQQRGLNAVILHVRAAGDALYPSSLEPWMRSLTGTQGGDPGWDPLQFAVAQAHERGLELHAWFNPFRAGNLSDTLRLASNHFGMRRPDVMKRICGQLWFDPGEPASHDQAIAVITDVLRRYPVDAVHLDDYFYPYPSGTCTAASFPDSALYARYQATGGTMGRDDWRRDNINRFVERLYRETHAVSPTARVGISPFGIWRPGTPPGITGLDSYASIYADSRLWLQRGWVDYFAPQLYWSVASTGQNFLTLVQWWAQQNTMSRHLWPGLASYRVMDGTTSAFSSSEIPTQVDLARQQASRAGGATGVIFYNATSVRNDRGGWGTTLRGGLYAQDAIPPATPWLDASPPADPVIAVSGSGASVSVTITDRATDTQRFLVRWRVGGSWRQRLVPRSTTSVPITATGAIEGVVVNAIDRVGNASGTVTWRP